MYILWEFGEEVSMEVHSPFCAIYTFSLKNLKKYIRYITVLTFSGIKLSMPI